MNWKAVAAVVALAALPIAACGSDGEAGDGGDTSPAVTNEQPGEARLGEALLSVDDLSELGTGWTETQRAVFATREPENPSIDPSLWCPAGEGDELVTLAGPAGADVELSVDTRYLIRQQAWSNPDVERYLATVKDSVDACSGATWEDDGGNTYTLEPAPSVPAVGDDSVSWRVTIELAGSAGPTSFTDQTVARFGDALMVLQAGATPVASPDAFAPNYVAVLRTAAAKFAGLGAS